MASRFNPRRVYQKAFEKDSVRSKEAASLVDSVLGTYKCKGFPLAGLGCGSGRTQGVCVQWKDVLLTRSSNLCQDYHHWILSPTCLHKSTPKQEPSCGCLVSGTVKTATIKPNSFVSVDPLLVSGRTYPPWYLQSASSLPQWKFPWLSHKLKMKPWTSHYCVLHHHGWWRGTLHPAVLFPLHRTW